MAVVIDQEYIPIRILEMFETLLEGPTIVATHYGLSHCLVMFASEMPVANKYLNRLLWVVCYVKRMACTSSSYSKGGCASIEQACSGMRLQGWLKTSEPPETC